MAVRTVIEIDEELCNGCGQCVDACHEGAIRMVDGKAKLVSDVYCDGLGDCIGECPVGAIRKIRREAADYDQAAVDARLEQLRKEGKAPKAAHAPEPAPAPVPMAPHHGGGCPGAAMQQWGAGQQAPAAAPAAPSSPAASRLSQWPVQLTLVPPESPFLAGADLVVCADCVPFAVPDFHERYLKDHAVVMACPKLDPAEVNAERLDALIDTADIRSLTVLRMEVPCCGGIAHHAVQAWKKHKPDIPCEVHVIGIQGGIHIQTMVAV